MSEPAFDLKGLVSTLTVLRLRSRCLETIERQLEEKLGQLPGFFTQAPVVLDFSKIDDDGEQIDLQGLITILRRQSLVPVAAQNTSAEYAHLASAVGLGKLHTPETSRHLRKEEGERSQGDAELPVQRLDGADDHQESQGQQADDRTDDVSPTDSPPIETAAALGFIEPPSPPSAGLTMTRPVRAGKVVYAQNRDLVLLQPVNPGGEVIADGNIHVYARLSGRALAGAHGNEEARIFCANLDAELISIAGHYLRADEIPAKLRGGPAQAYLESDRVVVQSLS